MWKICFTAIVLAVLLTTRLCNGDCNVCNEANGAACTSNITFQLCFNGRAQGPVYSCPNVGDVCTNLGLICGDPESNSNVQADCGNTEQCERCTGVSDGSYACTSHNTFVMCQSDTPTSVTGTCPKNEVCLTSRAKDGINPCANQCLSNILDMCDIVSPNATTVMPPTETTTTKAPTIVTTQSPTTQSGSSAGTTLGVDNNVCANQTLVGRYQNPSDTTCRTYVYCSMDRTTRTLVGRLMTCPGATYFNPNINKCQAVKPAGCN